MSTIKTTKERADELLAFLHFERELYEDSCYSMLGDGCENEEDVKVYLKNFDDTIIIVKSVSEAL